MRLALASQGFTTDEIAKKIEELVEKINIAMINEAYVGLDGTWDKRWLIRELANIEKYIGGTIDFVNFRVYDKEEIKKHFQRADLIYIVGGRQHILEKLFRETDTIDILKQMANEKVIMGTSAGSIVLGKKITSTDFWKERYPKDWDLAKTHEELNFANFNIIPHYMREDHKKWTKSFFERVLKENPFPIYAITDTQMVVYHDGKLEFVGGVPEIFGEKKI